ncbi:MAG: SDR family oxidoreductase [Balneolaceae bacterium]|nr:MAG: SDR family oxidoreductase [Balneolaceae bacterium]
MREDFRNKVAVVTGGASGIGEGVALLLASRGASIAILDKDSDKGERLAKTITDNGQIASFHAADLSVWKNVVKAIEEVLHTYERVDILSCNAGIQRYGTVDTTTTEMWDEVMNANLKSVFHSCKACIPHLKKTRGAIVVMSSVQGFATQKNVLAYTTSKHALIGFIRAMALDMAEYGVRVNGVAPGSVNTPMLQNAVQSDPNPEKLWKVIEQMHPLGRIAQPVDIAEIVAFLAGPGAANVTGSTLIADGGLLLPISGSPAE